MSLIRDQRGQTMVFGAISLFVLVSLIAFVANSGQVVTHREEMQNAADAAARSGALTEANMLSTIAFLNDGMAYIYYNMMRYSTNVTVFGVLAELKEITPHPGDAVVGVADPVGKYNQAYAEADHWIPVSYTWLNTIKRVERAIALSGTDLIRREIRRTAVENAKHTLADGTVKGVEGLILFPEYSMLYDNDSYLRLDIERIDPDLGWIITSNTGYMIEIRRTGPLQWLIRSPGLEITIQRIGPDHYLLKTDTYTLEIEHLSAEHVIAHSRGATNADYDCRFLQGLGWAINAISGNQQVSYTPSAQGGFTITANPPGVSINVQRGQDGHLYQWNGSAWVPIPGEQDQISVGGKTIPIHRDNTISFPGGFRFDLPQTIHYGPLTYTFPDSIQIGGTGITLRDTGVRIQAQIGMITYIIDDSNGQNTLNINGLTLADADGRWRILSERGARHRLQTVEPNHYWIYEFCSNAAHLREDGLARLAHHAIWDNDPYTKTTGASPQWTTWFNPSTGNLIGPQSYYQTREPWDPSVPTNYVDEQGKPLVRRFASDMFHRNNRRYVSLDLNAIPRPFCLTDDFMVFGLNLAVWRDKDTPALEGNPSGSLGVHLFQNPAWGYFATASARCAFLDNTMSPPGWRTTFDTYAEVNNWANSSYQNLYEPVWNAMLVSTRESVKSEHIDCIAPDTGTNFVWRGLAGGGFRFSNEIRGGDRWHDPDPPEEFSQFRRSRDDISGRFFNMTNRAGNRFDPVSPDLPEAIDH